MDAYLAASGRIYVLDTVRLWLLYMISKLFSLTSDHVWLAFITEFLGSACERSGPHRGYTHLPTRGKLKALPKTNEKKQSGLLYALIWELLQTQRKFNNVWSHLVHWEGENYHSIGWGRGWKCYFDNHSSLRRCLCRFFFFATFLSKIMMTTTTMMMIMHGSLNWNDRRQNFYFYRHVYWLLSITFVTNVHHNTTPQASKL